MTVILSLILAMVVFTGCANEDSHPPVTANDDGKADAFADDVYTDDPNISCRVVMVHDGSILEETLGAIYWMNEEGFTSADESSIFVEIKRSDFSVLESGLLGEIGGRNFGLHDTSDTVERFEENLEIDLEVESWRLLRRGQNEIFTVRLFPQIGMGVVIYRHGDESPLQLANLDCREIPMPGSWDFSTPQEEVAPLEEIDCLVVDVLDDSVLEEALGVAFDIDTEGNFRADENSVNVALRQSQHSVLESQLMANIGQINFGVHDAGDRIEQIQEETGYSDYTYQSYQLQLAGAGASYIVRVFLPTLAGVVLYESRHIATLECGGTNAPERQ